MTIVAPAMNRTSVARIAGVGRLAFDASHFRYYVLHKPTERGAGEFQPGPIAAFCSYRRSDLPVPAAARRSCRCRIRDRRRYISPRRRPLAWH
ncbi:hypothetical protein [Nocardia sp. R7R-8]|uniref:hypothetical protein n=1 Tax=Nocardia sp. R7R-8 TaxID=3459304 RepID=UPI00403DD5A8